MNYLFLVNLKAESKVLTQEVAENMAVCKKCHVYTCEVVGVKDVFLFLYLPC